MSNRYFESRPRQFGKTNALAQELKLTRDSIVVGFGVPPAFVGSEEISSNRTTLSIDVAKVEETQRREYKKIEQVNMMYKAAKALGFPKKVSEANYRYPYYVVVSIPRCFDSKYYPGKDVGNPCFFYRLKITSSDAGSIYDEISETKEEIPNFILWLLVCMKLFYKMDWDGRKWIDQTEGFTEHGDIFDTTHTIPDVYSEIASKLAEKMAKDIDNEIMMAIKQDPKNWKVQIGKTIYGGGDKVDVRNLPSVKVKLYDVGG